MVENGSINPKDWVKDYADYLYGYAMTRINDKEIAAELVQETFLAALEALSTFNRKSSIKTWLTAILKNKVSDEYKRISREKPILEENNKDDFFEENGFWKEAYQPREFGLETDSALLNKELEVILTKCMKKLPGLWRSVASLKFIEEEKSTIICQKLQITNSNFWVIIHRAKLNLRNCLQKNWIGS
ncbi:sigma-70 family RNA polymerase sigma factor [Spirosoma litoris]